MLAYKNRILKNEDFIRIKKCGRAYSSGNVELKIVENSLGRARAGLIVGLQFSKKAIERNRTKRWARETLREYMPMIGKNKDLLLIIRRRDTQKIGKDSIKGDIKKALEKTGLIK